MLVALCRRLTPWIRRNLCALSWEAASGRSAKAALEELFQQQQLLQIRVDEAALHYGGGIHPKHRLTGYHDFFCSRILPGEKVLDVGCGYGAVAKSMADTGAIVTGIDIDGENIRLARSRFGNSGITFIEADATQFLPSDSFDVVVLSNVLEHIEDRQTFLKRLLLLSKPAKCLIRVPTETRDWSVPLRKELGLPYFSDPGHYEEYTEETFRKEMKEAGLEVQEMISRWGEFWVEVIPRAPR